MLACTARVCRQHARQSTIRQGSSRTMTKRSCRSKRSRSYGSDKPGESCFEQCKVKGAGGGSVASIHVGPDDKQIVMCGSETILAASLREGIPHAYACGGRARCSICRISVEEGLEFCSPRSKGERIVAERLNFSPETRLACQTKITGDVNVRRLVVDDDDIEFTRGIAEGPRPASIGEERKLAILFADIRGFTALSERMSPYDVVYFLNRYFHLTSKVIASYGGYVDNYMGDGLMAVFGHDDAPDASFRAVSAALTMLEEVKKRSRHF